MSNLIVAVVCSLLSLGGPVFGGTLWVDPPTVLFPPHVHLPSTATLTVRNSTACFKWRSSDDHVVHVQALGSDCSRSALVSGVTSSQRRQVTRITAFRHTTTGELEEVDCMVIADQPAVLEVSHPADRVHLGGPPTTLAVSAKDSLGSTFTSINGLKFEWTIEHNPLKSDGSTDIVARLHEGGGVDEWTKRGLLGHQVTLWPEALGTASVTVRHQDDVTARVEVVVENLATVGGEAGRRVRVLLGAQVPHHLQTLDGLPLSNENDFSRSSNTDVLVNKEKYLLGEKYGSDHLTYNSKNTKFPHITIDVEVVKPAYMKIEIAGGESKYLEEMRTYFVTVDLYDAEHNRIHSSENLRVSVVFPSPIFHVNWTSSNGARSLVQTLTPGKAEIRAHFLGVRLLTNSKGLSKDVALSHSVQVTVCQRIKIHPPHVLLPANCLDTIMQEVSVMVTGGTGQYHWFVNDSSAAIKVDEEKKNVALIGIANAGHILLTVSDKENVNFVAQAKVSVQPVVDIEAYPAVLETEVGNSLIVPVAFLAYEDKGSNIFRKFDDCSKIKPRVEIIETQTLEFHKEPHIPAFGKGCTTLQFRCKHTGYSRVNIFIDGEECSGRQNNRTLKTTMMLSCFKPLKPVHPVRVAVTALGTSKEIAFEGGPRKWPLLKSGHFTTLEASTPDLVNIELIKDPVRYNKDLTVFRVLCKSLGESTMFFRIGNKASPTNPHPALSEASLKIVCGEPESVHLKLTQVVKPKRGVPSQENVVKVPFYGAKLFTVEIYLKDSVGRKFSNISSLGVEWTLSDPALAEAQALEGFETHENAVPGYRKVTKNFKEFQMVGGFGKLQVSAKVKDYRKDALAKAGISSFAKLKEISTSVELKLVSLRDVDLGLYKNDGEETQGDDGLCDSDSCKL